MASHRLRPRRPRWLVAGLVLVLFAGAGVAWTRRPGSPRHRADPPAVSPTPAWSSPTPASSSPAPALPRRPARRVAPSPCRTNADAQRVIVSVHLQHAWMCAGARPVRDSAVTTGTVAAGGTPAGTWHVQAKQTDRWLGAGGESYQVRYWMPYDGDYGFHDALWQTFPYGAAQYRTRGSHGCVHFPLAVMAWLYGWAQVGATVTITA